jgi:putative endonuclease
VGRLQRHNGRREQFTRTGVPWQVVHTELFSKKNDALARERQIKNYKNGKVFKELLMHGSSLKK